MERKVKILVVVLAACLAVSLFFNGYQYFMGCEVPKPKTFVYEWASGNGVVLGEQQITNETLRLELTVEWGKETLNMVAKINDDDFQMEDYMGLVFDKNGNGFIDVGMTDDPYLLLQNHTTDHNALTKDGTIEWMVDDIPYPSPYHYCVFTEGVGYTFNITIPKSDLSNVKADMMYVTFQDHEHHHASVPDEAFWVSVMVEGWQ